MRTIKSRAHIGWPNERQWNGVIFDSQLCENGCWYCNRAFDEICCGFPKILHTLFKLATIFYAAFNKIISKISSLFTSPMQAICWIFARSLSSMKHIYMHMHAIVHHRGNLRKTKLWVRPKNIFGISYDASRKILSRHLPRVWLCIFPDDNAHTHTHHWWQHLNSEN